MTAFLCFCAGYLAGFWTAVWVAVRIHRWAKSKRAQESLGDSAVKARVRLHNLSNWHYINHDYAAWKH